MMILVVAWSPSPSAKLLQEVKSVIGNEEGLKQMLEKADKEAKDYAKLHIKGKAENEKENTKKTARKK